MAASISRKLLELRSGVGKVVLPQSKVDAVRSRGQVGTSRPNGGRAIHANQRGFVPPVLNRGPT